MGSVDKTPGAAFDLDTAFFGNAAPASGTPDVDADDIDNPDTDPDNVDDDEDFTDDNTNGDDDDDDENVDGEDDNFELPQPTSPPAGNPTPSPAVKPAIPQMSVHKPVPGENYRPENTDNAS